jgi:hypothetical protein
MTATTVRFCEAPEGYAVSFHYKPQGGRRDQVDGAARFPPVGAAAQTLDSESTVGG